MSDRVEWAHASERHAGVYPGNEPLSDGNTANENGHDDYVAVAFGQCAIYGTPIELIGALTRAARDVARYVVLNETAGD